MSGTANSGRRPKPSALRVFEGQRGHRPIPDDPNLRPNAPACPDGMAPRGAWLWGQISSWLGYIPGLLTEADWLVLKLACDSYAEYEELSEFLRENQRSYRAWFTDPSGAEHEVWKPRPEVLMRERARKAMDGYLSRLGLSPADRVRLATPRAKRDETGLLDVG